MTLHVETRGTNFVIEIYSFVTFIQFVQQSQHNPMKVSSTGIASPDQKS